MADTNPHRKTAYVIAVACYVLAGIVLVVGTVSTLAAATAELSGTRLERVTNGRMAFMVASVFAVVALMTTLFGWRVQKLFGQRRRQDKLAPRSAVGCLRLGSLGCGLWALLSTFTVLVTGKIIATDEPAGVREIFVGSSGFILAMILMLSVAWFISANFLRVNVVGGGRVYQEYVARVQPVLLDLAELETRAYVQEQTVEVLAKMDAGSKSVLMEYLSRSGLLNGNTRIVLQDADFRGVDLHAINLPRADLHGINLERADLQDAILFEADLNRARLNTADLSRANLQGAILRHADLTDALLEGANLSGADLTGAIVTDSQLGRARRGRPSGA
jgi:hypothetical protein